MNRSDVLARRRLGGDGDRAGEWMDLEPQVQHTTDR